MILWLYSMGPHYRETEFLIWTWWRKTHQSERRRHRPGHQTFLSSSKSLSKTETYCFVVLNSWQWTVEFPLTLTHLATPSTHVGHDWVSSVRGGAKGFKKPLSSWNFPYPTYLGDSVSFHFLTLYYVTSVHDEPYSSVSSQTDWNYPVPTPNLHTFEVSSVVQSSNMF